MVCDLDDEEGVDVFEEGEEWVDLVEELGVGEGEDVDEVVGEGGVGGGGCEVEVEGEEGECCGDGGGEDGGDGYEGCEWGVFEGEVEGGVEEVVGGVE